MTERASPADPDEDYEDENPLLADDVVTEAEVEFDDEMEEEGLTDSDSDDSIIKDEAMFVKFPDAVLKKHNGAVFCGKIFNSKVITGGEDDTAVIWDASSNCIVEVVTFTDSVIGVDFSHDGAFASMGDMKGVIQVREMENNEIIFSTDLGTDMTWLKWHPNKYLLFIGTVEGDVFMYHIPAGACQILQGQGSQTDCGAISGGFAAIGYFNGLVGIFDTNQAKSLHSVFVTRQQISCIDMLEERNLIAAGDVDGYVTVIGINKGQVIVRFRSELDARDVEAASVESVVCFQPFMSSSCTLVAAGNMRGHLYVWDVSREAQRYSVKICHGITKLLKHKHFIYAACLKGKMYKVDSRTGDLLGKFQGHTDNILDICLSHDGSKLLSSAEDTLVCVYSIEEQ